MNVKLEKSGEYHKEVGIRLIGVFKSSTILVGFWNYMLRIEL